MDEEQYTDRKLPLSKRQKIVIGVVAGVGVLYVVGYVRGIRKDVDDLAKAMSYTLRTQDYLLRR